MKIGRALQILALIIGSLLFMAQSGATANPALGGGGSRVVAALGTATVQGQDAVVEVLVVVPPGLSVREAVLEALGQQGARPFESAELGSGGFTLTGLVWDSLPVDQNYNPANEPASLGGGGLDALTNTHTTWDGVATSFFDIDSGGLTSRCPSLVRECPGPQRFDGNNDVGWLRLKGSTLGVTWYGTSRDEADMALNVRYNWSTNGGGYDVETVFLHENGHVVGLGHSDDLGSVMQTYYHDVDRDLGTDDEEGATYLYDSAIGGSVSGTVTDEATGDRVPGATVILEGTSRWATTDEDGDYSISNVPDPVTYTVIASASGFDSATIARLRVDGAKTADFALTPTAGDNGGGGNGGPPPCKGWRKDDLGCP